MGMRSIERSKSRWDQIRIRKGLSPITVQQGMGIVLISSAPMNGKPFNDMATRTTFMILALVAPPLMMAQTASGILDVNNVSARFGVTGMIGMAPPGIPGYFVPKTPVSSPPSPLFAAGLWIGGLQADKILHFAGERYQQLGHDFFPGPLGNGGISQQTSTAYDRVWSISQDDVAQQIAYFNCLNDPECDPALEFPGHTVPDMFYSWPAHGDVGLGQAYNLADFYDFDNDGSYDPDQGDAPCQPGDASLFCIYNDVLSDHTESAGHKVGVEVHMTAFAYTSTNPALDNTIFVRYRIFNRGSLSMMHTLLGLFADIDLGCNADDHVQCDVGRNLFFVLNGDDVDNLDCPETGYGAQPPAFGIAVLKGPLMDMDGEDNMDVSTLPGFNGSGFNDGIVDNERHGMHRFIYFTDLPGPTGDPVVATKYYGLLNGLWGDGTPFTYSGTGYSTDPGAVPANFAFPGDSDPLGVGTNGQVMPPWTEASAGNPPGDRRGVAAMGPFLFDPGDMQEILLAFIYARATEGGAAGSAQALRLAADTVRAVAETMPGLLAPGSPCGGLLPTGTGEATGGKQLVKVRPNPAHDRMELRLPSGTGDVQVLVVDALGRVQGMQRITGERSAIDVSALSPGLYLVKVTGGPKTYVARFIKE